MSSNSKNDDRFLDKEERALVAEARHPALSALDPEALRSLARRLRERRDRARSLDRKHASKARGADDATAESGNRRKSALLSAAVARVNKEYARRAGT